MQWELRFVIPLGACTSVWVKQSDSGAGRFAGSSITRQRRVRFCGVGPVGAASRYNFGRMAAANCSSADREGGAPAGDTATRR